MEQADPAEMRRRIDYLTGQYNRAAGVPHMMEDYPSAEWLGAAEEILDTHIPRSLAGIVAKYVGASSYEVIVTSLTWNSVMFTTKIRGSLGCIHLAHTSSRLIPQSLAGLGAESCDIWRAVRAYVDLPNEYKTRLKILCRDVF
jgi:hypothetical protein